LKNKNIKKEFLRMFVMAVAVELGLELFPF
jgi:hypothetical protein